MDSLSRVEAVRIALAAQGLAGGRRSGKRTRSHVEATVDRLGLLQMDSVNVLTRAHYMPLYSRLGPYDPALLDGAAWTGRRRSLFEYWAHEASLLPLALFPLFRWRMARAERGQGIYGGIARLAREQPALVEEVYRAIETRGALAAGDIDRANHKGSAWWGWTDTKIALEYLFWAGRITAATRRGFERNYDLTERVIPPAILDLPQPTEAEAQRALLRRAGRALGIATGADLADYFRLDATDAKMRLAELAEDGGLRPVTVEGWRQPAWLAPEVDVPARGRGRALISPFDPLIWHRPRTERLFEFRYRIEIYTPAHKREHGYYVLPFLLGERLVARLDLKADRKSGVLKVAASHLEAGNRAGPVAEALTAELRQMASWLGLSAIRVEQRGDLAPALATAVSASG